MTLKETGGAKLVVLEKDSIRVFALNSRRQWLLGRVSRDAEPEIPLESRIASRQHGWLMGMDEEWFYVDNPRNLNGTWLNGNRIPRPLNGTRKPITLRDGDVLRISGGEAEGAQDAVVMLFLARSDMGKWAVYPLQESETVTVVRDRENGSRRFLPGICEGEARITCLNGWYYLTDCGSTAGTVLNGKPLSGTAVLRERDHFSVSGGNFFFLRDRVLYER